PGDRRLIGYIVSDAEDVDLQEIREHTAATLPSLRIRIGVANSGESKESRFAPFGALSRRFLDCLSKPLALRASGNTEYQNS
ncbi:hypothetical protein ABT391_36730, partial [Streptomyces jumonjinensis]|uniref:hypothetical protein n=1 Tax=Streptomyces jumonjinensis TaxID=1945 RepID=UPI00332A1476